MNHVSRIIIIGAGPAGLMAAQHLATHGHEVHVYEQNKAAARKFLVAGDGGFNLTHSEPVDTFVERYDAPEIKDMVRVFDNEATVSWLSSIGIPTYAGSSGKVFPVRPIKPIQVLQAWLKKLQELGVSIFYQHRFVDFDADYVYVEHKGEVFPKKYDKLILGLGGGSWQKTGSDASWIPVFEEKGIEIAALASANSGYNTTEDWSDLEGQVLKNITISHQEQTKAGEIVFTSYGIEGSPLYYMNRFTRGQAFPLTLYIDLKTDLSEEEVAQRLSSAGNMTTLLKAKLKLSKTTMLMLRKLDKKTFTNPIALAQAIKNYPIQVTGLRPIDEVISTAGGISFEELDENLALHKFPNIYCVGEMLDWEAPTGGYLLQGCFSTGALVGRRLSLL